MNIRKIRKIPWLLAFALIACQNDATPQTAAIPSEQTAPPSQAATASTTPGLMSVQPSRLNACDPPTQLLVKWDTSRKLPEAKIVEIWVAESTIAEPKLFTASVPVGEIKTGAWMRPGSVVILKAQGSAAELARIVINGPTCPR